MEAPRVSTTDLAGLIATAMLNDHPASIEAVQQAIDHLIALACMHVERAGEDIIIRLEHGLRDATSPAAFTTYNQFIEGTFMPKLKATLRAVFMHGLCGQPRLRPTIVAEEVSKDPDMAEFEAGLGRFSNEVALAAYGKLMEARIREATQMADTVYKFAARLRWLIGEKFYGKSDPYSGGLSVGDL